MSKKYQKQKKLSIHSISKRYVYGFLKVINSKYSVTYQLCYLYCIHAYQIQIQFCEELYFSSPSLNMFLQITKRKTTAQNIRENYIYVTPQNFKSPIRYYFMEFLKIWDVTNFFLIRHLPDSLILKSSVTYSPSSLSISYCYPYRFFQLAKDLTKINFFIKKLNIKNLSDRNAYIFIRD